MILKKNPKIDAERKRSLFFQIGLIIAIALAFTAFEWKFNSGNDQNEQPILQFEEEELPPVTMQKEKIEKPKKIEKRIIEEAIEVLNNEMDQDNVKAGTEGTPDDTMQVVHIPPPPDEIPPDDDIHIFVPEMPEFPGGDKALFIFFGQNLKYPQIAVDNSIQGTIFIKFVVEKDGSIGKTFVVKGGDRSLEKEAIRVVKKMPKWKPGRQNFKPVRVWYNLPVKFALR